MGEGAPTASAVLCPPTLLTAERGKQRRWGSRAEDWAREERRRGRGEGVCMARGGGGGDAEPERRE